jgi:hypothetical protein
MTAGIAVDAAGGGFGLRHRRVYGEVAVGFQLPFDLCDQPLILLTG